MSTNLLATSNLVLLATSLIQALQHALAFRRAHGVHALGVAKARVLHVCAPEPPRLLTPRPWPLLTRRATPCPLPLIRTLQAAHGALQCHRQSPLGGMPASATRPCRGSAAQATAARQLPSGTARAHPRARPLAPVVTMHPLATERWFAVPIHVRRQNRPPPL